MVILPPQRVRRGCLHHLAGEMTSSGDGHQQGTGFCADQLRKSPVMTWKGRDLRCWRLDLAAGTCREGQTQGRAGETGGNAPAGPADALCCVLSSQPYKCPPAGSLPSCAVYGASGRSADSAALHPPCPGLLLPEIPAGLCPSIRQACVISSRPAGAHEQAAETQEKGQGFCRRALTVSALCPHRLAWTASGSALFMGEHIRGRPRSPFSIRCMYSGISFFRFRLLQASAVLLRFIPGSSSPAGFLKPFPPLSGVLQMGSECHVWITAYNPDIRRGRRYRGDSIRPAGTGGDISREHASVTSRSRAEDSRRPVTCREGRTEACRHHQGREADCIRVRPAGQMTASETDGQQTASGLQGR